MRRPATFGKKDGAEQHGWRRRTLFSITPI